MTDTAPTAPTTAPPTVTPTAPTTAIPDVGTPTGTVAAPPAPTVTTSDALLAQVLAELQSVRAELDQAKAAAPAPLPTQGSATNLFTKGQLVKHTWDDPFSGRQERYGLVVAIAPTPGGEEPPGASSKIVWFAGVSGFIGDHEITAV